jgi:hypothetical protein
VQVRRLGPNADGEQLQPGRVTNCYLAILLDQPLAEVAPEPGRVLVVAPAALLAEVIPQPHGQDFLHYRLKAGNGTTGTGTGLTSRR